MDTHEDEDSSDDSIEESRPLLDVSATLGYRLPKRKKCSIWRYFKNPNHWPYRYIILVHLCAIRFFFNLIYEAPGGLEGTIIQLMGLDTTQYDLIYSVYSWSIIPTALVGGIVIDRVFGIRLGLLIFVIITNIGQLVTVLGVVFNTYWLVLVGRFVMGLGAETCLFTVDAFALLWFKGKEMNFVFGVMATANRLGGAISLFVSEPLYEAFGFVSDKMIQLGLVFIFNLGLSLMCVISSGITLVMDKRAEPLLLVNERNQEKGHKKKCFSLKDLKSFNLNFWLIALASAIFYGAYYPLVTIGQLFYVNKYGLSINLANTANMLIYLVTVTAPLVGIVITFIGFPIYWGLFGLLISTLMHLILALSGGQGFVPFVVTPGIALAYDIFKAGVWPLIGLIVPENLLTSAFGVVSGLNNLFYACNDIIIAVIIDQKGYFIMEMFFILLQAVGLVFLLIVIVHVAGSNSKLDMSGWRARKLKRREKDI